MKISCTTPGGMHRWGKPVASPTHERQACQRCGVMRERRVGKRAWELKNGQ